MNMNSISRRDMLALAVLAAMPAGLVAELARAASESGSNTMRTLDRFIAGYCAAMNAPGLTLAIADGEGPVRVASYGYVDLAAKTPVSTAHLFEIGSITKSFVGLTILQLHDEGKVDLQAPIRTYLPWLSMETSYGEILVHHLLTHSSGMPDDAPLIPVSPERRPRQALKPGAEFHYSNWGYDALGRLIETVDGRPWHAAVGARILKPVGMNDTAATITSSSRSRIAQSYMPMHDDRPYPRHGALVPAGNLAVEFAAGSIASTPRDMALYMQMILNRGQIRGARIVSESSFKLFSTPHIAAPPFGPEAGYGYGLAVDKLDGHVRLRHTGGMVSFMSAIHMDLDAKLGAFASINAQLGYRPNPVAQLALQLLRAEKEHSKVPSIPEFDPAAKVESAASYSAVYTTRGGRHVEIKNTADQLNLIVDGRTIPLQQTDDGSFISDQPGFNLFPIVFERADAPKPAPEDKTKPPITALSYGAGLVCASGIPGSSRTRAFRGIVQVRGPVLFRESLEWHHSGDPATTPVVGGWHRPAGSDRQSYFQASAPKPNSPGVAGITLELIDGKFQLLWIDGVEFQRVAEAQA